MGQVRSAACWALLVARTSGTRFALCGSSSITHLLDGFGDAVAAGARGLHRSSARGQLPRARTTCAPDACRTKPPSATNSRRSPACEPGELVITRNTTESLDTVINGYDWKPGDEAVMATQDYNHMLAQFTSCASGGMINSSCRFRQIRKPTTRSCSVHQRDHTENAAADGVSHDQHHRPDHRCRRSPTWHMRAAWT